MSVPVIIKEGDGVILKKGDNLKFVRMRHGRKDRMENFVVDLDCIIGQPFGSAFHVENRATTRIPISEFEEFLSPTISENLKDFTCESDKDNRSLVADCASQKLSYDEIEDMKRSGQSSSEIVGKIVGNSSTFQTKTQYSQDKYIKKKKKRHMAKFQALRPKAELLCRMMHSKAPAKVIDLRPDTLSQLLLYSNVHYGSNVLLMESCQGLISGAVMERLGGAGQIVQVFHGDFAVRIQLEHFDFHRDVVKDKICGCRFSELPGAAYIPREEMLSKANNKTTDVTMKDVLENDNKETADVENILDAITCDEEINGKEDNQTKTANDIKVPYAKQQRAREKAKAWQYLEAKNLDCLIIVTKLHPLNPLLVLFNYLAPSSPFAVYCQFKEPLMECFVKIRQLGIACDCSLIETWCRDLQVLPSRTHPQTVMSASGGYLLTGIKVDKELNEEIKKENEDCEPDKKRTKFDTSTSESTGISIDGVSA